MTKESVVLERMNRDIRSLLSSSDQATYAVSSVQDRRPTATSRGNEQRDWSGQASRSSSHANQSAFKGADERLKIGSVIVDVR